MTNSSPIGGPVSRVQYTIDGHDIITATSAGFAEFADENDATGLSKQVLGQPIWQFMYSEEVNAVYQRLFSAVRKGRRGVSMTFRCDSRDVLRFMKITVEPHTNGYLMISTDTLLEVPRARVLSSQILYNSLKEGLPMCSHCNKIYLKREDSWMEIDTAVEAGMISDSLSVMFGLCGSCKREFDSTIKGLQP